MVGNASWTLWLIFSISSIYPFYNSAYHWFLRWFDITWQMGIKVNSFGFGCLALCITMPMKIVSVFDFRMRHSSKPYSRQLTIKFDTAFYCLLYSWPTNWFQTPEWCVDCFEQWFICRCYRSCHGSTYRWNINVQRTDYKLSLTHRADNLAICSMSMFSAHVHSVVLTVLYRKSLPIERHCEWIDGYRFDMLHSSEYQQFNAQMFSYIIHPNRWVIGIVIDNIHIWCDQIDKKKFVDCWPYPNEIRTTYFDRRQRSKSVAHKLENSCWSFYLKKIIF